MPGTGGPAADGGAAAAPDHGGNAERFFISPEQWEVCSVGHHTLHKLMVWLWRVGV
jgi:hypothetical protein